MSTPYKFIQARADFGQALLSCFKKNDWPQSITESVAKEIGIEGGPWASQVSTAINGKLDPKTAFFIAFGMFNAYIHAADFSKIKDINLRDKLKGSKAFTHNNGKPFDGADFFRLFAGLIEVPKKYKTSDKTFSSESLKEYQQELIEYSVKIKRQEMLKPKEFWELFLEQPYTKTIKEDDLDIINDLLREDMILNKDIVIRFTKSYGKCPVFPCLKSMSKIKPTAKLLEYNSLIESSVTGLLAKERKSTTKKIKTAKKS
tara:strand:- start:324 stop:1100 length:777 start_codon:yes stop_codon:yes gene_type:complete